MLFFIILGLIYEEKSTFYLNKTILLMLVIFPIIYIQLLVMSNIFIYKKEYRLANLFNPFNKKLYSYLIEDSPQYWKFADSNYYRNLDKYLFYADSETNDYLAMIDIQNGEKKLALEKLKISLLWDPFGGDTVERVNDAFLLIKDIEGNAKAKRFINDYIKRIKKMDKQKDYQKKYLKLINNFEN
jgi:hypothetical protein